MLDPVPRARAHAVIKRVAVFMSSDGGFHSSFPLHFTCFLRFKHRQSFLTLYSDSLQALMAYPSIISQPGMLSRLTVLTPGSAARNLQPVLEALAPLVEGSKAKRILELASYPYEHIRGYAEKWPGVQFTGTVRDGKEMRWASLRAASPRSTLTISTTNTTDLPSNVGRPLRLDIAQEEDWAALTDATATPYDGVIMRKSCFSPSKSSRKRLGRVAS